MSVRLPPLLRRWCAPLLVASAVLATPAAASAAPAAAVVPGQFTVGLSLPTEGFQVGVADGTKVIYARGLEIDLAQELAKRLAAPPVVFLQEPFTSLTTLAAKPWDLALAQVTITAPRATHIDFSVPYMRADQGVLLSQYVRSVPTSRAALRKLRLCATRGTTGIATVKNRIRPTAKPTWYVDAPTMLLALQLGRCDAVVSDLPSLATLRDRAPRRYGVLAGRIVTGEQYAAVLPKGSANKPAVDAAITAMIADGTIAQLEKTWLSVNLTKVPALT